MKKARRRYLTTLVMTIMMMTNILLPFLLLSPSHFFLPSPFLPHLLLHSFFSNPLSLREKEKSVEEKYKRRKIEEKEILESE
jgi:hypothetical protein